MKLQYVYISLTVIILIPGIKAEAQADISMATHWNNRANYNPAFIARTDYLYLFANTRHQWIGVNGAPVVYNLQISEYVQSLRSAFGISVVNDKIGVTKSFNPMFTYAFRIAKKNHWALSMGLSGGLFTRKIDGSTFEADNANDPSLFYYSYKNNQPDVNVGFEFQNAHFVYGISSTHILSASKSDTVFLNTNHRYGYAIYKNDSPKSFSFIAGMQVVNRYNLTFLEGNFTIRLKHLSRIIQGPLIKGSQEFLDFGLTYRTSHEVSLLCGIMLSPYLRIGYAYDQNLISRYYMNGTHEIMIEYRIPARAASSTTRCGNKEFWYR
jgi:type IX secretion system PorP/SprF family membrane protein